MTNGKTHTQKLNKFPLAYSLYLWSVPAVRTVCLLFLSGPAGQKYQSCRCCCRSLRRGCRPTNRTKNRFSQIKDDNQNRHFPLSPISPNQRRHDSIFDCIFTTFSHFFISKTTIRIVFLPLSTISPNQSRQSELSFYSFFTFPQTKDDNQNRLFTAFSHLAARLRAPQMESLSDHCSKASSPSKKMN